MDTNGDWLHWNIQSYVDSAIQIPTSSNNENDDTNTVFMTPSMEFYFSPIIPNGLPRGKVDKSNGLVLKDVKLGAHLNGVDDIPNTYNPCNLRSPCSIVDGASVGESSFDGENTVPYSEVGEMLVATILLLGLLFWFVYVRCFRNRQKSRRFLYQQVYSDTVNELQLSEH